MDTPDSISSLRHLAVRLAVTGKLVPQDPSISLSPRELAEGRSVLESRAREAGLRTWKPSPEVRDTETPFDLPPGWMWARINDTGLYVNGRVFKPSEIMREGLPIVRIQNLTRDTAPFNYAQGKFPESFMVRAGDILVSWSATLDAFVWRGPDGVLNQHIFKVTPNDHLVDPAFLFNLLRASMQDIAGGQHLRGLTMRHVKRGPFLAHVVALPPLAEQHRIAARVDELMALCDKLEAAQTDQEISRDRLVVAALDRLARSDGAGSERAYREHAHFYVNHLPRLTVRPAHVAALRGAIIDIAMRGKLVEQVSDDVSMGEVFRRAGRKVSMDQPREIPSSWVWSPVESLLQEKMVNGISIAGTEIPPGIRALRLNAIRPGGIDHTVVRYLPLPEERAARLYIKHGDFLLSRGNGSLQLLARGALVHEDPPEPTVFPDTMIRLRLWKGVSLPWFVHAWESHGVRRQLETRAKTAVGLWKISQEQVGKVILPVPPLSEQKRIVARMDHLMGLCKELELQIIRAQSTRRALLEAVTREVLAGPALASGS